MSTNRVRVVQGSCWPCKKRRVKCDLTKPVCRRCALVGTSCDYNARLIRWSKRPITSVPATFQVFNFSSQSTSTYERQALDYFHARVWPLLSTSSEPCAPPTPVALQHRVVLLATCLLADSHRLLQDGHVTPDGLSNKRQECLAVVRAEVDSCCVRGDDDGLLTLLFAVLFLYLADGFMECTNKSASTWSHHTGVLAILDRLGGLETMLKTGPEALRMLLSEFASAELTAAVIQGRRPSFAPAVWDTIDQGSVWWGRDPMGRCSLASVFKEMSGIAFYLDDTAHGLQELSMDQVRIFEHALRPVYAPLSVQDLDSVDGCDDKSSVSDEDAEAFHAFTLMRAFQHGALIFLYRALCGLPALHPLVQQHVQSCLDSIFEIHRPSHVLNCVIFPLFVAGAHAKTASQRTAVLDMVKLIYDDMRFASVQSVSRVFDDIWQNQVQNISWTDMFAPLSPHALVL